MLSDEAIARASIGLAIIGFFLLCFAVQPAEKKISELTGKDSNTVVSITARVLWTKNSGNTIVFGLSDGNAIEAVFFNPSAQQKETIKNGAIVKATGKVTGKAGNRRFIATGVEKID